MSHIPQDSAPLASPADKAEMLYKDYLAGGPDAAYRSLKNDYEASADMCNRDQYFQTLAADLQASGHMPNLAIGWLKAEKDHIDDSHSGVIKKEDILRAETNGGLDAIFGPVVLSSVPSPGDNKTFFDQIAHTKKAWINDPDAIEDADLRKYSRQMHRAERHQYNQEETAKACDPLFENNAALLKALDTDNGGERNGFVSRHEMKNFLKEYKEHPGRGAYTAENAEYINEVLHGQIGRINNPPLHGFSVTRLEKRAGITDADTKDQGTNAAIAGIDNCKIEQSKSSNGDGDCPPTEKNDVTKKLTTGDDTINLEIRNHLDTASRIQTGEGYNAVAARLLNISEGHKRSAEEIHEITLLGHQIARLNGGQSTFHLRPGVVLPVSANLDILTAENPRFKAVLDDMTKQLQNQ